MRVNYKSEPTGQIPGARIAILQAQWHHEHTDRMVTACSEILGEAGCSTVDLFKLPGCYELPLAAKICAKMRMYEALIVFGAIVKGDTDHYTVILDTCIRELGRVMYDFDVPVIMEILPVHNLAQLEVRSTGAGNKGIEAAQAAVQTIAWHKQFATDGRAGRT